MTKTNVPRLRFRGFDSEWTGNKVGNLALVTKLAGFEFSKYVKYNDEGNIVALRGLNVKNDSLDLSDVKYIDYSDFSKLKRSKLFIGDILFTYVGTVGNSAIVKENDKFYLAPNVALIRIKDNNLNSSFFQKEISTDHYFRKVVYPLAASSSQMALSMESIRKFKFWYCSIDEQERIGSFFAKIDKIIELQTQKLEQLSKLKRGYLQKMFPQDGESVPRLRFSGFSGEWEKQGLLNLVKLRTGSRNAEDGLDDGKFVFFDRSSEIKFLNEYDFDGEVIVYAGEGAKFLPRKFNGKYSLHQRAYGIYDFKNINFEFLYQELLNKNNHFLKYAVGTTAKSLRKDCFEKLIIKYPSVDEQQQIGSFLSKLDQIINDQSDKIDELKRQKKAYLQKMFI